jgi:hypothetical protein
LYAFCTRFCKLTQLNTVLYHVSILFKCVITMTIKFFLCNLLHGTNKGVPKRRRFSNIFFGLYPIARTAGQKTNNLKDSDRSSKNLLG